MGVEEYLKKAEQMGFSDRETAMYLTDCSWDAQRKADSDDKDLNISERRELWRDCLECRIRSSLMFDSLGDLKAKARSLDFAGNPAHSLGWMKYKADLKEEAAQIYESLGEEVSAAYSYLHAADALILKSNRDKYTARIDALMEKGLALLRKHETRISPDFAEKITKRYEKFKEGFFSRSLRQIGS